jgi:hypothetical protein
LDEYESVIKRAFCELPDEEKLIEVKKNIKNIFIFIKNIFNYFLIILFFYFSGFIRSSIRY